VGVYVSGHLFLNDHAIKRGQFQMGPVKTLYVNAYWQRQDALARPNSAGAATHGGSPAPGLGWQLRPPMFAFYSLRLNP
jgi:hypothetical protein